MQLVLGGLLWVSVFLPGSSQSTGQRCLSGDNDTVPFRSFTQPPDQLLVVRPEDGLQPLYNFARVFLEAVQPNAFPGDIISKVLKNEPQDIPQLLQYEAGYLVCLIMAVLYLLLMPIAGGILVWQYFHSGKAQMNSHQPPKSTTSYSKDVAVSGCLVLITLLLLTGVILAFSANNRSHANMNPSLHHLHTNVRIVEDSLRSIPQKVELIMEQYNIPKSEISKAIYESGDTIGATIFTSFNRDVQNALTHLSFAVRDALGSLANLRTVETTRTSLQSRGRTLQRESQQLQSRLEQLKCRLCVVPDSSDLETDADYSQIPSVQDKLDSSPPKRDLEGLVEQSDATFLGIPQFCSDQMAHTKAALLLELNKTQESMMNASRSFPSLHSLSTVVSELRTSIRQSEGSIDYYDYVRWAVAFTLCTVMLVIVLLMMAALSIGLPVLFNPTIYPCFPDARLGRTALSLFQVSMLLSFAFSWLFVVLVFITLFLGGNIHTLGCRSFTRGQMFTFLDQQEDLFSSLKVSRGNQTVQHHFSTSAIYQNCLSGRSMFRSMDMNQLFDLEDFLNSTKYLEGFSEALMSMSFHMNDLKLLSDDGRDGLLDFRRIGLDNFNYDTLLLLLSEPVMKRDLAALAQELNQKAELPENTDIKADLQEEATKSQHLHSLVMQQTADAVIMSSSVRALRDISQTYKGNVDRTLSSFSQADAAMSSQVPYIVGNVSQCTLQRAERSLLRYLDWLRHAILDEVMECHWLARSVDNVYTAVCLNVIDPLNGFWLSLGWCCACLAPGIILIIYVTRRLRAIPPTPVFIWNHTSILPGTLDGKLHTEKKDSEKTKPNIYMTYEELCDDQKLHS